MGAAGVGKGEGEMGRRGKRRRGEGEKGRGGERERGRDGDGENMVKQKI